MVEILKTDALIFGGGVAGLWLLNRLRSAGYSAWLLESGSLGQGQSVASQGIIHSGLKYINDGTLNRSATTVSDMPGLWRSCLQGQGDVDLQGTRVLSDDYYMLPRNSLRARLLSLLGSKALASKTKRLAPDEFPAFFQGNVKGPMYRIDDFVIDVPSLLTILCSRQQESVFSIDWNEARLERGDNGAISGLVFNDGTCIEAQQYISCCGGGTESLLRQSGLDAAPMQRRPLQQVMVRHRHTGPVYVHCVSSSIDLTPELTITTHSNKAGQPVWYLGGRLAEDGAGMNANNLIDRARRTLTDLFPWCDFDGAEWATLEIDRAEAKQADGRRPEDASLVTHLNLAVCWPTKLTLAPALADKVLAHFQAQGIAPSPQTGATPRFLSSPRVAATPWENL